jgi:hypothetical protein
MGGYGGLCASADGPHHVQECSCLGSVDAARVAVPTRLKQAEKMLKNVEKNRALNEDGRPFNQRSVKVMVEG